MICGIDEAGRGPIAGPLVVAGCILSEKLKVKSEKWYENLTDSKKLSEKKREELFEKIIANSKYHIVFKSNKEIDEKGLSKCLQEALIEIKNTLKADKYIFDGNSNFGVDVETLVKGDSKIKEISAASILAKVSRDRFMKEIAAKYPQYNFKKHKGYITKEHKAEIAKYGMSDIHRKSYKLKPIQKGLFD